MKRLISLLTLLMALSVNAQVIHWINFTDDKTDTIEGNCRKNSLYTTIKFGESIRNLLYGRFIDIVSGVLADNGYIPGFYDYYGHTMTPNSLEKAIEALHCGPNDIVIFCYIGYGTHGSDENNPYPQMTPKPKDERMYTSLQWMHDQLKSKNPALLVSFALCHNDYYCASAKENPMFIIDDANKKGPTFKVNYGTQFLTETEKQTITELFLGCKGDILLSSASPGQYSYACKTPYGFTDILSTMFVYRFETDTSKGTLNWYTLLNEVKELVHDASHGKQTPIFECNITSERDSAK